LYKGRDICPLKDGKIKDCARCVPEGQNRWFPYARVLETSPNPILKLLYRELISRRMKRSTQKQSFNSASFNENEEFLAKLSRAGEPDDYFKERHKVVVGSLNSADRIWTPSTFIRDALKAFGVNETSIQTVAIGLDHFDKIALDRGGKKKDSKLTFAFRGTDNWHKGVQVFLEAIRLMNPELRESCRFIIRGVASEESLRDQYKDIPELEIHGSYHIDELHKLTDEYDVGVLSHLWFENSPLALLEHRAAGKPVLTSRLGGVSDFIEEGKNGWFFRGGDSKHLSEMMEKIVVEDLTEKCSINEWDYHSDDFFGTLCGYIL
jgi:glycosyltransferase involved in cell wall biosynthesis